MKKTKEAIAFKDFTGLPDEINKPAPIRFEKSRQKIDETYLLAIHTKHARIIKAYNKGLSCNRIADTTGLRPDSIDGILRDASKRLSYIAADPEGFLSVNPQHRADFEKLGLVTTQK